MDVRIEGRKVTHRFAPGRGLEPLSFVVEGAGLAAVTGPNGSGKSTLLRVLAGLLRPGSGDAIVSVGGREVPWHDRRFAVGWCAPELQFYAELTVEENLRFAAEARGLERPTEQVRRALAAATLIGREADRPGGLSSGLRQRLRLAFAILGDPPVLLFDEPGSHLDEPGFATLTAILNERRNSARVLVATNDPREWSLADERIAIGARGLGDPA